MKMIQRLSSLLGFPSCYQLFQHLVGQDFAYKTYIGEYVKPAAGDKILDLGCGPAAILNHLPAVNYTGLDISPEYIASAQKQFGTRGRFLWGDVGLASIEGEQGTFDLVMATGVLHHLDDTRAAQFFALARGALRPGGCLVSYDGCHVPHQSRLARWLLANDRGRFVRTPGEYQQLASAHFSRVQPFLRHDLLRIPYTHLIMRCCS